MKKSNYLTKKCTNWTPRLLSCPNCKKYARNSSALGAFALRVRRQTVQCPTTNVTNTPLRAAPTSRDFETTPAKFLMRCASKTQKVCSEFANFCTENLRDLGAKRGFLRRQTLRRLKRELHQSQKVCAAHDSKIPSQLSRAAPQNRKNYAPNSRVVDENFPASTTSNSPFFDNERNTDSVKSCIYVLNIPQSRRLKFWCVAH